MATEISPRDDTIGSRDVTDRITELENEITTLTDNDGNLAPDADPDELDDLRAELARLTTLEQEGRHATSEWDSGAALVRDGYFTDHARDYAEGLMDGIRDASWPLCHIDWDEAAGSLQMDYTSLEWEGKTFWVR